MSERFRVICLGNALRGDDGVGPLVASALERRGLPDGVEVLVHRGDGLALLDLWEDAACVVLVDAVSASGSPGTVVTYDFSEEDPPRGATPSSTHGLGLQECVEMGRALGMLPQTCLLVGVIGSDMAMGASPAGPVSDAVARAADRVCVEIEQRLEGDICTK